VLESFSVVKHNKYFMLKCAANFLTVFSPSVDEQLVYRYLAPKIRLKPLEKLLRKKQPMILEGEAWLLIKQQLGGLPITFLQPFVRQLVNWAGGPLRTQRIHSVCAIACNAIKYWAGLKSTPRIALVILMESVLLVTETCSNVAGEMLDYEFYDYVELQTGERSEGVTRAVDNLFSKIVTNNVGTITGNTFLDWTGYKGGYSQEGTRPPARYVKWMWPMFTVMPLIDNVIWLTARSLVKWTPEDRIRTEAALAERRALVEAAETQA
jgi:Na+/melibiose symporter-like transporter